MFGMSEDATNETLRQLSAQLGRVEGKLDGVLAEQSRLAAHAGDTSRRVGEIEKRDAKLLGVAAGVSAAVSFLAGWVKNVLGGP